MNKKSVLVGLRLMLLSISGLGVVICSGCAVMGLSRLSADPVDATVVDADTGQPIEGVIALAYWELNKGNLAGDSLPCGSANVEEAISDKAGHFHLPGWGPIKNPCGGVMRGYEPMIWLFKPGYHYNKVTTNGLTNNQAVNSTDGGGWSDSFPMKLKKFGTVNYVDQSVKSYFGDFGVLDTELSTFIVNMPAQCNWRKIPNMLQTVELERRKFSQMAGFPIGAFTSTLVDQDSWFQRTAPQCGSPKAFIEGLLK